MDNRNVSILGMRSGIGKGFLVEPKPFGIEQNDRLRHLYIVGKTGTGKTTLLQNLILQDIEEERGFALIDPLGDFGALSKSPLTGGASPTDRRQSFSGPTRPALCPCPPLGSAM